MTPKQCLLGIIQIGSRIFESGRFPMVSGLMCVCTISRIHNCLKIFFIDTNNLHLTCASVEFFDLLVDTEGKEGSAVTGSSVSSKYKFIKAPAYKI